MNDLAPTTATRDEAERLTERIRLTATNLIEAKDKYAFRRPEWLPGQPGDVAEFTADAENEHGDPVHATRWMRGRLGWWAPGMGGNWISDDDVPADAVLVLPAPTRT